MKRIIVLITVFFGALLFFMGCSYDKTPPTSSALPDGAYELEDKRINKTNLTGKYMSSDDSEFFFEIYEDYAILSDKWETYIGFSGEYESKILEIEYRKDENRVYLNFVFVIPKETSNLCLSFYSDGEEEIHSFTWFDNVFPEEKVILVKQ